MPHSLTIELQSLSTTPVFCSPNWIDLALNMMDWLQQLWSVSRVLWPATWRSNCAGVCPHGVEESGKGYNLTTVRGSVLLFASNCCMEALTEMTMATWTGENGRCLSTLMESVYFSVPLSLHVWLNVVFLFIWAEPWGLVWWRGGSRSARVQGGRHRMRLKSERKRTFLWS